MSVASRVFRGFGNGTVVGTVVERVHRGYTAGIIVLVKVGYLDNVSTITYATGASASIKHAQAIEAQIND